MTEGMADPVVRVGPETLSVIDDRVFGPAGETLARRFARGPLFGAGPIPVECNLSLPAGGR